MRAGPAETSSSTHGTVTGGETTEPSAAGSLAHLPAARTTAHLATCEDGTPLAKSEVALEGQAVGGSWGGKGSTAGALLTPLCPCPPHPSDTSLQVPEPAGPSEAHLPWRAPAPLAQLGQPAPHLGGMHLSALPASASFVRVTV